MKRILISVIIFFHFQLSYSQDISKLEGTTWRLKVFHYSSNGEENVIEYKDSIDSTISDYFIEFTSQYTEVSCKKNTLSLLLVRGVNVFYNDNYLEYCKGYLSFDKDKKINDLAYRYNSYYNNHNSMSNYKTHGLFSFLFYQHLAREIIITDNSLKIVTRDKSGNFKCYGTFEKLDSSFWSKKIPLLSEKKYNREIKFKEKDCCSTPFLVE